MAKSELADPEGGRYAVEYITGGALGTSLHKHLAETLNQGAEKGWEPILSHGLGSAGVYIVWDKHS
jgi:hypothetical protein